MNKKIKSGQRKAAVRDYRTSGEGYKVVARRHGISHETLRRFVMQDSLDDVSVVAAKRKIKDPSLPNANRRWTKTEDGLLSEAVTSNMTVGEAVELLGRTPAAIMCRKHYLIETGIIDGQRFRVGDKGTYQKGDRLGMEEMVENLVVDLVPEPQRIIENAPKEEPNKEPGRDTNIQLRELAELVRDFGVHITMVVTPEGTEIKMHN